jgi:aminocarboxymuconate-semialdehyde decarboxylase
MPARFYVDSLLHDAHALGLLLKLLGAERIAFGSDYPFSLGETQPGKLIESMKLHEKEKEQMFSQTVREFLRL